MEKYYGGNHMKDLILKEGMKAPDFTLMGSDKKEHKLSNYVNKKVILYFYPKDNTPGCSQEAQDFKNSLEHFNNQNTIILGISRDSLISHNKFISKYNLPFILLSDEKEEVCNLYAVLKEKTMFGKKSIGIERSTFLIDENGIITNIYRKVKVPGHVEQLKCSV
jgi:peroxiredoxin Q/BCP